MKPGEAMAEGVEEAPGSGEVSDFDASVDDFAAAMKAGNKAGMRSALRAAVMACMEEEEGY